MNPKPLTIDELERRLAALPRVQLGAWPTPLEAAERLSGAWGGPRILVKRDDLSGLALGGNKVRHLEFRMGMALAQDCDVVVMAREPYSNNARQTAAAAARLGLRMVLLIPSEQPVPIQGNRLLEELLGADVRVIPTTDPAAVRAAVREVVAAERASGHRPFDNDGELPDVYGLLGYVAGAAELARQCQERGIALAAVYIAAGFSHAGLALGARLLGLPWQVVGVAVELRRPELVPRQLAAADEVCRRLGLANPLGPDSFEIAEAPLGAGFQDITPDVPRMLAEAARLEGLILDPIYTAKVAIGLKADARAGRWGRDDQVVLIHSGGVPALFSFADRLVADPVGSRQDLPSAHSDAGHLAGGGNIGAASNRI